MKVLIIGTAVVVSNCSVTTSTRPSHSAVKAKKVPPGHAKKMNGDKSAKNYAPGRNK